MTDPNMVERSVLLEMYRRMNLIRTFEEAVIGMVDTAELVGTTHISIGQEGAIVGACLAVAGRRLHDRHAPLARASDRQGGSAAGP